MIRIGTNLENVTPMTDEVKFKYVTSFTLLGVEIDNKLCNLSQNFELRKKENQTENRHLEKTESLNHRKSNNLKNVPNITIGLSLIHDGLPQGNLS